MSGLLPNSSFGRLIYLHVEVRIARKPASIEVFVSSFSRFLKSIKKQMIIRTFTVTQE